jgi:plastocyanin
MNISRLISLPAAGLALGAVALLLTTQFAHADNEIVLLEENGFSPADVVISEGDSVTWNNDSEFACTVTFPGGTPAGSYAFPFSLQFDEAGTYGYQCAVVGAATFSGTVTVEEDEDEGTPTATATSTVATQTPTATNTPTNTPTPATTVPNTPTNTPTTAPATATPTTASPTVAPSSPTAIPTPIPPATGTGGGPGGTASATLLLAALALIGGGGVTLATARAARRS